MWSLTRMPAGRPAGTRAIVAARSRTSASMAQPCSYVNRIGPNQHRSAIEPDRVHLSRRAALGRLRGVGEQLLERRRIRDLPGEVDPHLGDEAPVTLAVADDSDMLPRALAEGAVERRADLVDGELL